MSDSMNDPMAVRYSRLGDMELFRNKGDGNRFTFELRYPDLDYEKGIMWKQLDNPFQRKGFHFTYLLKEHIFIKVAPLISDQPPFIQVGSTWLYHNETPATYDEAIKSCESHGAKLVEFWDEQEYSEVSSYGCIISHSHQVVFQFVQWINKNTDYWIGLTDRQKEGTFLWESGRKLSSKVAAKWGKTGPQPNRVSATFLDFQLLFEYTCSQSIICIHSKGLQANISMWTVS